MLKIEEIKAVFKNKAFLLSLLLLNFLIWYKTFFFFFCQDDFFILAKVYFVNFLDLLKFFIPDSKVNYFRPLGVEFFFWICKTLFAFNPLAFHLTSYIFHIFNLILVYLLAKKIGKDKTIALLVVFFWSLSAVHFLSLSWVVNFSFILGTFFYFFSFLLWINKRYLLFFISFIFGLLSNELVISLPIIILGFSWIFKKKNKKRLIFPFLITFLYFLLRFFVFRAFTAKGDYQISFNPKVWLNNYQWYLLWSFGWPETMRDQMVNLFMFNRRSDFLSSFKREFFIFIFSFYLLFISIIVVCFWDFFKNRKKFIKKVPLYIFCIGWFITGLLPIIFFPKHSYPHYACISLFGLVFFISYVLNYLKSVLGKLFVFIYLLIWLFVCRTAIDLNLKVHWLVWHSQLSKKLIAEARAEFESGQEQLMVRGDVWQNKLVLSDQAAMKVIFDNDKIKTVYIEQ